jgi:hypothetical protein
MTPKEKADELFHKFYIHTDGFAKENAKMFAFIAVEEILEITSESYDIDHINWWQEVKQEMAKI